MRSHDQGEGGGLAFFDWKSACAASACLLLTGGASADDAVIEVEPVETNPAGELIDASDPAAVAALLAGHGFEAILSKQETGAVQIKSSAAGESFWLYFQACDEDFTGCEVITLSTGFDFETPQTEDIFADWNRQKISKAYLDEEGDPYVEFSINMLHGVSRENFIDTLNWFAMEMAAFMDQIGWSEEDSASAQPI